MTDKTIKTSEEDSERSPVAGKKTYERPVLIKLGALRDVTLTQWSSKGRRDGQRDRNTGRGGMNGLSRNSVS